MTETRKKHFNVTGLCVPGKHYMVDTSAKIEYIVQNYIQRGQYFTINRARQFGKTTTLNLLADQLRDGHIVLDMSFEGRDSYFESFGAFVDNICGDIAHALAKAGIEPLADLWRNEPDLAKPEQYLRERITETCALAKKPVIMIIDEVDRATDFEVFVTFLGILRDRYLEREAKDTPMFQSVILAGVHDVKNLRKKIRPDSEHSYNSPWNIAANFTVDLSFSTPEIATMLTDYENDHNTGMDIAAVSERLHYYTSGYPFLVSRLCKYIDELPLEWNTHSVDEAERLILKEDNTLFDDIIKNVLSSHGLAEILRRVLLEGDNVGIMRQDPDINLGLTFGIIVEKNERVVISNIIFETLLTDFFIFQEEKANASRTGGHGGDTEDSLLFIRSGNLDMDAICSRFAAFMRSEYRDEDSGFIERQARLLFLSFLKPIINGVGHYVVEPETRGSRRMDVVVFYNRKEYIVELKIWRGEAYEQAGIEQLTGYLRSRGQRCGWLVSFCDLKRSPRESGTFVVNDLTLRETVVAYRDER